MPITQVPTNMLEASQDFLNLLINGDCRVAQRGTVAAVNNSHTYGGADRISVFPASFTTFSGNIAQATAGTATASGFAQSVGATTTGVGSITFAQRIEARNTAQLAGKTVTLSAKVYHDVGSTVAMQMSLYKANAADNFSAVTQVDTTKNVGNAATGVYTSVSATFTIGSADAANGLMVFVTFTSIGAVTSKTFAIGDYQFEIGAQQSPFAMRPINVELAMCQRYFINSILAGARTAVASGTGAGAWTTAVFPTTMRITPTITGAFTVGSTLVTQYSSAASAVLGATSDAVGNWAATLTATAEL